MFRRWKCTPARLRERSYPLEIVRGLVTALFYDLGQVFLTIDLNATKGEFDSEEEQSGDKSPHPKESTEGSLGFCYTPD